MESAEDLLASDPESLQEVIKAATTAIDKMRLNINLILVSGTNEKWEGLDLEVEKILDSCFVDE